MDLSDVTFMVSNRFKDSDLRALFGKSYLVQQDSIRTMLLRYVSHTPKCTERALQTQCIGVTESGAKLLKTRLAVPGGGKSGGLRLGIVADCQQRELTLVLAVRRNTDPPSTAFFAAANS